MAFVCKNIIFIYIFFNVCKSCLIYIFVFICCHKCYLYCSLYACPFILLHVILLTHHFTQCSVIGHHEVGGQPRSFSDMRLLLWGDGVGSCRGSRKNLHPFRIFSVKSPWLSELAFWQLLQTVCCNLKCHKNRFICLYCRVQLSKYVLCMLEHAWVHFNSHTHIHTYIHTHTLTFPYKRQDSVIHNRKEKCSGEGGLRRSIAGQYMANRIGH